MKRQLLALGLLATSVITILLGVLLAHALETNTIHDTAGGAKSIDDEKEQPLYPLGGFWGSP